MVCAPWLLPPHQTSPRRTSHRPHAPCSGRQRVRGHVHCPTPSITVAGGGDPDGGGAASGTPPRRRTTRKQAHQAKGPIPVTLSAGGTAGPSRRVGGVFLTGRSGGG